VCAGILPKARKKDKKTMNQPKPLFLTNQLLDMKNSFLSIAAFCAMACLVQCKSEGPKTPTTEVDSPEANQSSHVTMTTKQIEQTGITLGNLVQVEALGGLLLHGEVAAHRDAIAQVNATTDGIVRQLNVQLFGHVRKGQVIALLSKPELIDWQQALLEGRDKIAYLQAEYDRYAQLKDADATASKNFKKAAADLRAAQTTQQMHEARLRQYQIDPARVEVGQLVQTISISAPETGVVTELTTNQGAALQMGSPICTITSTKKQHLDLFVYEQDLAGISIGQMFTWLVPSNPDKVFQARVYAIDPMLDLEKKTVRVHAKMEGTKPSQLAAGQLVQAELQNKKGMAWAIPDGGLVREGQEEFLFTLDAKKTDSWVFKKHALQSAKSKNGLTQIRLEEPLPESAQVVTKGAYYISAQGIGVELEE
jgi:membrane fusion protein, heavy metal efflux system